MRTARVVEIQKHIKKLKLESGRKKLILEYKGDVPKDIDLLIGKEVEVSDHAIYLNDDMIMWVVDPNTVDFMVKSIKEILDDSLTSSLPTGDSSGSQD
jgi:hypothetical protein